MINMFQTMECLLGLNQEKLFASQMILRAFLVYIFGILLIRLDRRFVGERTAFDNILRFLIGSSLANAVTGSSPYFPTILMTAFIVFLNWMCAFLSFYNKSIEKLLKGSSVLIYKDKKINHKALKKHRISEDDLHSELRKIAGIKNIHQAKEVFFENSGEISVIKNDHVTAKSKDIDE